MADENAFRPVVLISEEGPIEPIDVHPRPESPSVPAEPPPILEEPDIVFTDGPCPPGYVRVSVDAVDAHGRFEAGFSYCERRDPKRSEPPHEAGPRGDHDPSPEP